MLKRVLSGVVLALFFAAVILFNESFPLALNIVVALISVASVFELTKALGLERKWFLFLPALAMAAAGPLLRGRPLRRVLPVHPGHVLRHAPLPP